MVAVFSIIGFMVLLLIYFVVRQQSLRRELSQAKHVAKATEQQSQVIFNSLSVLSNELQKSLLERLNTTQKHGLISKDDHQIISFILGKFSFIIGYCSERDATVEEAVKKALESSEYDLQTISQFVARQPNEVKIPWTKNQLNGFIISCRHLCAGPQIKTQQTNQNETAPPTNSDS